MPVLGLLYREFKKDKYYFECIRLYSKMTVVLIMNLLADDDVSKGLVIMLVLIFYSILAHNLAPY